MRSGCAVVRSFKPDTTRLSSLDSRQSISSRVSPPHPQRVTVKSELALGSHVAHRPPLAHLSPRTYVLCCTPRIVAQIARSPHNTPRTRTRTRAGTGAHGSRLPRSSAIHIPHVVFVAIEFHSPHRHPWRRRPNSTRHSHQLLTWPHLEPPPRGSTIHTPPHRRIRAPAAEISREARRSPGRRRKRRPSRKPWAHSGTCPGRRRRSPWRRRWRRTCSRCQA